MIVDYRFNVSFLSINRVNDGWVVGVQLFPDPATLKRTDEFYDKNNKRPGSIAFSGRGKTQLLAFADALDEVSKYLKEKCDGLKK